MGGATPASDSLYSCEYFLQTPPAPTSCHDQISTWGDTFGSPWAADSRDGKVCNQTGCPNGGSVQS